MIVLDVHWSGWSQHGENLFSGVFDSFGENGESHVESGFGLQFGDERSGEFVTAFSLVEEILVESEPEGGWDVSLEYLDVDFDGIIDGEGDEIDDADRGYDFLVGLNLVDTDRCLG